MMIPLTGYAKPLYLGREDGWKDCRSSGLDVRLAKIASRRHQVLKERMVATSPPPNKYNGHINKESSISGCFTETDNSQL
jgi:hypothetical protein